MSVIRRHPVSTFSPTRQLVAFAGLVAAAEAVVFLLPLGGQATPFALVLIPAVAALVVSAWSGGTAAVRNLVRRLWTWRVAARWYAAALLIPVAEKLLVDATGLVLLRTREPLPERPGPAGG